MDSFDIREGVLSDFAKIEGLYPVAFPNEDLRPVVRALLQDTPDVLSLVAIAESALIGHVAFTPCSVTGGHDAVVLLGPLAVATAWQKRDIGSALVRAGLDWLRSAEFDQVFVLSDPAYYARLGFEAERSVAPPFPLPEEWREAWQSIALRSTAPRLRGTLSVPRAWNEPNLWAP
jgi:putative acetyltransferase